MRFIFYVVFIFVLTSYLMTINNTINYKNTKWNENSPTLITINPTNAQFCFSVTEPAAIYWRVYNHSTNVLASSHDLTNTNTIIQAFAYGGNISAGNNSRYTNNITNLLPNSTYYLYSIAVSYIGTFPKEIKKISFKTLN